MTEPGTDRRRLLLAAALVLASVGIAVQGRVNGGLAAATHRPLEIAVVNMVAGVALGTVALIVQRRGRAAIGVLATALRERRLPWWQLLGGVAGAAIATAQAGAVAVIGVAAFSVALVAGQTSSGALLDRLGLSTGTRLRLTPLRILSIALAVMAVVVAASGQLSGGSAGANPLVWSLMGLSVVAGMLSSVQVTLNGRVARASGSPLVAAWVSFGVSLLSAAAALGVLLATGVSPWVPIPVDRPWLLLAGWLGLLYVMAAAAAVRPLGLLLTAILTVVGSLGGGLLIDLVVPTPGAPDGWQLVVGVVLAGLAAFLAARGRMAA